MKKLFIYLVIISLILNLSIVKKCEAMPLAIAGVPLAEILTDLCLSLGATYLTYEVVSNSTYKNAIEEEVYKHLNSNSCDVIQFKRPTNPKNNKNDFDKDKFSKLLNGSIQELILKEQKNINDGADKSNNKNDYDNNKIDGIYYSELVSAVCVSVLSSDSVLNCAKNLNSESKRLIDVYSGLSSTSNVYSRLNVVPNFDNVIDTVMYYDCLSYMDNLHNYYSKFENVNSSEYELVFVSNYYDNFDNRVSDLNYQFVFQKKEKYRNHNNLIVLKFQREYNTQSSYYTGVQYQVAPKNVDVPNTMLSYVDNYDDRTFKNRDDTINTYSGSFHLQHEFNNKNGNDDLLSDVIVIEAQHQNNSNYGTNYTYRLCNYDSTSSGSLGVGIWDRRMYINNNVNIYFKHNCNFMYYNKYYYRDGKMYDISRCEGSSLSFEKIFDLKDNINNNNLLFDVNNINKIYYNDCDNVYNVPDRIKEADDKSKKKKKIEEVSNPNIIEYPYFDETTINNNTKKIQDLPEHNNIKDTEQDNDEDRLNILEPAKEIFTVGDPLADPESDIYIKPVDPEGNPINQEESQIAPDDDNFTDDTNTSDTNNTEDNVVIAPDLTEYFPFCLPFDLIKFIKLFEAEPEAPSINMKVPKPDGTGYYNNEIKLDSFDPVAGVFRFVIVILFCIGLIKGTAAIMGGGRD